MITMYGISNCDTIKKAKKWLEENKVEYLFHDYKKLGIEKEKLEIWCNELGYENVINRRGTTWRKLPETDRENLDQESAITIMLAQPSIIKRPVLENDKKLLLGFSPESYKTLI